MGERLNQMKLALVRDLQDLALDLLVVDCMRNIVRLRGPPQIDEKLDVERDLLDPLLLDLRHTEAGEDRNVS